MRQFLWGALAMASFTASLLFLRYGKVTRDRLFLFFAAAFAVLAANWIGLAIMEPRSEHLYLAYVLRLIAFTLIIVGIVDKNLRASRPR